MHLLRQSMKKITQQNPTSRKSKKRIHFQIWDDNKDEQNAKRREEKKRKIEPSEQNQQREMSPTSFAAHVASFSEPIGVKLISEDGFTVEIQSAQATEKVAHQVQENQDLFLNQMLTIVYSIGGWTNEEGFEKISQLEKCKKAIIEHEAEEEANKTC